MRTSICATVAATVMSLFPAGAAWAQCGGHAPETKKAAEQKTAESEKQLPRCPVMGEAVDFSVKTMTDDGPVYFCCEMCIPKFKKDPSKYAEKLATQRAALSKLDRVQVSCPVDDKGVDGKLSAEVGGQTVAFCSKDCQAKYTEHPGAFKAKLADSYTYQTRCPISGEQIQPNAFTDLSTGQRIYFCCASCSDKLLKDPAKYAPKLEGQGIKIDAKKLSAPDPKAKKDEHSEHKHP